MKRIIFFVILVCFAFVPIDAYTKVQEASGSQILGSAAKGSSLKSDPIKVRDGGVTIRDYQANCAKSVWIERQNKGYRSIFKKFFDLSGLKNFSIQEPGTYYIYPVPSSGCQRASITIKYED